MRQAYYLANHDFRLIAKSVGGLCLTLFLAVQIAIVTGIPSPDNGTASFRLRFEQLLERQQVHVLGLVALLSVILILSWDWNKNFVPSRSIYRLYRLSLDVRTVFMIRFLVGCFSIFLVHVTYLVSLSLSYMAWYRPAFGTTGPEQGLYLAFVRSDFYRLVYPLRPEILLFVLLIEMLLLASGLTLVNLQHLNRSGRAVLVAGALAAVGLAPLLGWMSAVLDTHPDLLVRLATLLPLILFTALLLLLNLRWVHRRTFV